MGVTERQLMAVSRYENSDAFDDLERAALDLAVAMAKTPTNIASELTDRLRRHFDEAQLVELAATIDWENYQARLNVRFAANETIGK